MITADGLAYVLDEFVVRPLMAIEPVCEWLLAGLVVAVVVGLAVWWWTLGSEVN